MKLELAVLPMDVWADVFVYPWIKRKKLAQIVHKFKELAFAEKLQTFLHDPKCGKHSLQYLQISSKHSFKLRNQKTTKCRASLAVSPNGELCSYMNREFPQADMPENITKFNQLSIGFLDNQVIDFLAKIKPIFTNVFLDIKSIESMPDMRILLGHLVPMLVSIRGIECNHTGLEVLEEHFPGTLALASELDLYTAKPAFIPTYLDWLNAPLGVPGPRFLKISTCANTIFAIIDQIRKQFMAATASTTFSISLELDRDDRNKRAEEFTVQNTATNELLAVRNAVFQPYWRNIHYVEVVRHPIGAEANMRELVKEWAYYERKYAYHNQVRDEAEQVIFIAGPQLTIGQITHQDAEAIEQDGNEDESAGEEEEEAGPSAAKKMKMA